MPRYRIVIRRDTYYEVNALSLYDAIDAAKDENFSQIDDSCLDYEMALEDECFEIDENGDIIIEHEA
jgi:hypothetical protein